jgi:hypothetical protein
VGLHELLSGTDLVKKQIQERARVAELLATALNEGMRTLKMDGIEKILSGITDLKQVRARSASSRRIHAAGGVGPSGSESLRGTCSGKTMAASQASRVVRSNASRPRAKEQFSGWVQALARKSLFHSEDYPSPWPEGLTSHERAGKRFLR